MANNQTFNIGIVGAGGWGTALALLLTNIGHHVVLWTHERSLANELRNDRTNSSYLPGVEIPSKIEITTKERALDEMDMYFTTVPTQYIRTLFRDYSLNFSDKPLINGAKGIEQKTMQRISEIYSDMLGINNEQYVVLTGPSHAEEVARQMPTTVVAASENTLLAKRVQEVLSADYFRVYTSSDVIGSEIGGALKNVIAIAAGVIDGLGLGDNTKSALITRGVAEISRLGISLGAVPYTFSGLSGLGDLIATCASRHSRNRYVGEQIGKGFPLSEIMKNMKMVAEGVTTTESAYHLALKHGVDMPITEQMYRILFNNLDPKDGLKNLMNRKGKNEYWW
ncbi:MAG: NAD(P)H-dependent glycerol-3-phosphate dehydrogenase [Bacteroidota bacterium]|nr:NAD(P)H-dependent glycerol-3-phosphate dehydrogenase [Bacteroidota bacterium]